MCCSSPTHGPAVPLPPLLDPPLAYRPLDRCPRLPRSPTPCSASLLARFSSRNSRLSFVIPHIPHCLPPSSSSLLQPTVSRALAPNVLWMVRLSFSLPVVHSRRCAAAAARTLVRRLCRRCLSVFCFCWSQLHPRRPSLYGFRLRVMYTLSGTRTYSSFPRSL